MSMNSILMGAGELYLSEFSGSTIPSDATIEAEVNNVGHCSGGFTVEYKPTRYEVKNQYNHTIKSFITEETFTAKTGILTWDIRKLALLSTATATEASGTRTVTFGAGFSLPFEQGKELTINLELTANETIRDFLARFDEELGTQYTITITAPTHGTVAASDSYAAEGDIVTLDVLPAIGYEVSSVTVNSTSISASDGTYRFAMPGEAAIVAATFTAIA